MASVSARALAIVWVLLASRVAVETLPVIRPYDMILTGGTLPLLFMADDLS